VARVIDGMIAYKGSLDVKNYTAAVTQVRSYYQKRVDRIEIQALEQIFKKIQNPPLYTSYEKLKALEKDNVPPYWITNRFNGSIYEIFLFGNLNTPLRKLLFENGTGGIGRPIKDAAALQAFKEQKLQYKDVEFDKNTNYVYYLKSNATIASLDNSSGVGIYYNFGDQKVGKTKK
jgi:hypothetical protein